MQDSNTCVNKLSLDYISPERKIILKDLSNLMFEACMACSSCRVSLLFTQQRAQGGLTNWAQKEKDVQSRLLQSMRFQQEKELQVFCSSHNNKAKHTNNQGLDSLD